MKALFAITLFLGSMSSYAGQAELTKEQQLGEKLYNDKNLSLNRNQSCASCHSLEPANARFRLTKRVPGFVDPENVQKGTAVSKGSVDGLTGTLNAPSVGYAGYSPEFRCEEYDKTQEICDLYMGGQFWNGRASNLVEQAKGPFLNPVEMALPDIATLISRLKEDDSYQDLFSDVYGIDLNGVSTLEQQKVFELLATAISQFEKSPMFNKFNSKFDYVLTGKTEFSKQEAKGFEIFNGKGNCAACHVSDAVKDENGAIVQPPMFTDFTYDNIGLPRNVNIPGNPDSDEGLAAQMNVSDKDKPYHRGKHKVMSLRNIALTAPYGHNGSMATLGQVVHFYNTRDTLGYVDDINHPGFGKKGWPEPEIIDNLNQDELGALGLSRDEEDALVAFMKTLTDDYPLWGHDHSVPPGTPSPY